MDKRKERLLQMAAELYRLGIAVEKARRHLKGLVEQGVSYESEEMLLALREFQAFRQDGFERGIFTGDGI